MHASLWITAGLALACGWPAQAQEASAPAAQQAQACKKDDGKAKRAAQNQAIGRAADKKPIGIGLLRRARDKRLGEC